MQTDLDVAYSDPAGADAGGHAGSPHMGSGGGGGGGGSGGGGGGGGGGGAANRVIKQPTADDLAKRWETFNDFVASKVADGWHYDDETEALVLGKLSIPCESPKNLAAFVEQPGATTPIGPLKLFNMTYFINEVMDGSALDPDVGNGAICFLFLFLFLFLFVITIF